MALLSVFTIGVLAAGGLSYLLLSHELEQRLASDVKATVDGLALIAAEGDKTDLIEQIEAHNSVIKDGSALIGFIDAETGLVVGVLKVDKPFEGARRLSVGKDFSEKFSEASEAPEAYLAFGRQTDLGWIVAARDEAWVTESGEILVQTAAWALGAALLFSIALAVVIARRNERRVARMEKVLEMAGAGKLNLRINDAGDDDLAVLAERVDEMLVRLEAGVEAIRQVSTDVAHDLRAPLARLRMRLEPQALSKDVPADTRFEIGSALIDIDAISDTFDAILRLARLQSNSTVFEPKPVDLKHLLQETCDILEPSIHDAGHELRLDTIEGPAIVAGDADLLSQALTNLIDNAQRHCAKPAEILVKLGSYEDHLILSVCDNGPGIPERDRDRVLERFVRLDSARTVSGSGLGLSLVAAITRLHSATLSLTDNAPGLCVRIDFPRARGAFTANDVT
ncbi:sensor histidine kinase [Roseibium aggregatum]|uniref:sensor histidine kinase n=1 Tax=Roseibium aggregatum TaxID=187304 RepID=UPI001672135E|nr:HAMP domain-containing sensor histidine kinase [Roseibium aggregatum]UFI06707.1 HAMP domain-containing histidine kinase [Roseibium aggregatum]UFI06865.1 HAMP domain-containing histidine kinase [Roseibium aggregatum]